jgi:hypothetical protein
LENDRKQSKAIAAKALAAMALKETKPMSATHGSADRGARSLLCTGVCCGIAALWALAGLGVLRAQSPGGTKLESSAISGRPAPTNVADKDALAPLSDETGHLRREGTQLREQRGHFEVTGARIAFVAADRKTRFVGLENLDLQRIAQLVAGSSESLEWTVTGLITEYQGTNYLLVTRATRATANSGRRRSF